MTYWGIINYEKLMEWELGKTTVLLMPLFADLESWATRVKADKDSDDVYYLLFREKILEELPFLGSISSISRAIKELEDKGIIKCINKNSTPAYCLTEKGLSWKRKKKDFVESNSELKKTQDRIKVKIEKEKNPLSLQRKTKLRDLTDSFIVELSKYCLSYAKKTNIDAEQFDVFMNYHSSKGSEFLDWTGAFRNWCIKHKNFNKKANDGENKNGLYQ
jgi:DNA-binding PadR family transcriptional regulator